MAWLDNLVEAWLMNEPTAGNDIVGQYAGITLTQHNTLGVSSPAGYRDFEKDSTQYADHADSAPLSVGDIDFWFAVRVTLESKAANMAIVGKSGDPSTDAYIPYLCNYNVSLDRFRFTVGNGATSNVIVANNFGSPATGVEYSINVWHDEAANTLNMSVNDIAETPVAYSGGSYDDTGIFMAGALNSLGTPVIPFDGLMRHLHFWKRVPTSQERTDFVNGAKWPFQTGGMFFGA